MSNQGVIDRLTSLENQQYQKPVGITQRHHISYNPEIVAVILKGEHWIITQLQRRKKISKGFIKSLKVWIALHEDDAVEYK